MVEEGPWGLVLVVWLEGHWGLKRSSRAQTEALLFNFCKLCLSTVYNMAPAEGAPDEPGIDNPEQPPSGTNSELAELKRMFMDSQMESREREKRMCAALQSRNTLTEAGKLARVPPGTCYSSALVVQNCQLQKSDQ
ncbi:hypothetical protein COCOBI_18-2940 [Coccomyxa sp. Obi]|nr:hypothetical protein COCOBI_18-2940 [Coccomyxa sp. Obi]